MWWNFHKTTGDASAGTILQNFIVKDSGNPRTLDVFSFEGVSVYVTSLTNIWAFVSLSGGELTQGGISPVWRRKFNLNGAASLSKATTPGDLSMHRPMFGAFPMQVRAPNADLSIIVEYDSNINTADYETWVWGFHWVNGAGNRGNLKVPSWAYR